MSDCPAEFQSLLLGINHSLPLSLKLSRPLEDFYNYDAPGFIIKAFKWKGATKKCGSKKKRATKIVARLVSWSHLGLNQGLPDYESGALTN